MLLDWSAIIPGMIPAGCMVAIDHDIDRALPGTQRDNNAPIRPHRHEAGWRDQLNGEDKQRQRSQKTPRSFGLSDRPRHAAATSVRGAGCHHYNREAPRHSP